MKDKNEIKFEMDETRIEELIIHSIGNHINKNVKQILDVKLNRFIQNKVEFHINRTFKGYIEREVEQAFKNLEKEIGTQFVELVEARTKAEIERIKTRIQSGYLR